MTEDQIVRLTLPARLEFISVATAMMREVAAKLKLEYKDARQLELVAEEACVNVVEHAYEGEIGSYDIAVERRPGQIVVAVEDHGLPFDFKKYEDGKESGLGLSLMKAFADEVHFMNLGRRGKRTELVKNLPEKETNRFLEEVLASPSTGTQNPGAPPVSESDITIRLMRPDESASLARCAYRCYGYTYSTDSFYFPERVREMVESGLMVSMVAVTPEGEIVGHESVTKGTPTSLVGEIGQAIVDPRYRGCGLMNKFTRSLHSHNRQAGMLGVYGEAVTVHIYSQKAALATGAVETGFLLGFTPSTMFFKNIQAEEQRQRRPVVLAYSPLNKGPGQDIYLPAHHGGIMRRIYERAHFDRTFRQGDMPELPEHSQVNIKVQTEASRGFLQIAEYGRDLDELVKFRLRELCQRRVDCIYLDLPLSNPAVQRYCASLEMLGFFFGGILPEFSLSGGDVLRLQYINNAPLELEDVQLATDFSRALFRYVLQAGGPSLDIRGETNRPLV
jgi:anti-sigma regulatory factor (Ser/Thr protein kinase)